MNNNLSVELVLEFIKSHGGKVKNSVLVPHFKKFFNDPATKEQDRLKFKEIINTVATVKVENGEKFIYLKKKFRPNNGSSKKSNTNQSESNKSPSSSTSFYSEDKPSDVAVEPKKKKQVDGVAASIKNEQANANSLNKTEIFVKPEAPPLAAPRTSPGKVSATKQPDDTTSLKSSDGSGSLSRRAKHKKSTESPNMSERRSMDVMSRLSKSSTTASGESLRQRRPMSIYQQDIEQEGDYEREPTVLLQQEKQWLLSTCKGDLVEMRKLLDEDTSLIDKKDFITGYTALHWAAKKGNRDMTQILLDMKAKVNITSNGGYTPLHLAAMSGNEEIVTLLLTAGADANLRDYSGRQPIHYLKSLSLPLQSKKANCANCFGWQFHTFSATPHVRARSETLVLKLSEHTRAFHSNPRHAMATLSHNPSSLGRLRRGSNRNNDGENFAAGDNLKMHGGSFNPPGPIETNVKQGPDIPSHKISRTESIFGFMRRNSQRGGKSNKNSRHSPNLRRHATNQSSKRVSSPVREKLKTPEAQQQAKRPNIIKAAPASRITWNPTK